MAEYRVVSSSEDLAVSGSIAKILCLGDGAGGGTGSLTRIEFGNAKQPETSFVPTSIISTNTSLKVGTILEGPIGRVKVKNGGFFVYINK